MEWLIIGAVAVIGLVAFFGTRREPRTALGSNAHKAAPGSSPARAITDEVDPIAEAEVYLAYGRKEQAIEILQEALHAKPAREDIRRKINEIMTGK